tara:strand:+ start:1814 stop:2077 length:264 start_codon:yes stop_codon:yes gene_type:complete
MKFLITLIIFFNGEISPKIYTYQLLDFTDYKTCEIFINTKQDFLRETIQGQFPTKTIKSSAVTCLTPEEVNNLREYTMGGKWEQRHI